MNNHTNKNEIRKNGNSRSISPAPGVAALINTKESHVGGSGIVQRVKEALNHVNLQSSKAKESSEVIESGLESSTVIESGLECCTVMENWSKNKPKLPISTKGTIGSYESRYYHNQTEGLSGLNDDLYNMRASEAEEDWFSGKEMAAKERQIEDLQSEIERLRSPPAAGGAAVDGSYTPYRGSGGTPHDTPHRTENIYEDMCVFVKDDNRWYKYFLTPVAINGSLIYCAMYVQFKSGSNYFRKLDQLFRIQYPNIPDKTVNILWNLIIKNTSFHEEITDEIAVGKLIMTLELKIGKLKWKGEYHETEKLVTGQIYNP